MIGQCGALLSEEKCANTAVTYIEFCGTLGGLIDATMVLVLANLIGTTDMI